MISAFDFYGKRSASIENCNATKLTFNQRGLKLTFCCEVVSVPDIMVACKDKEIRLSLKSVQ